MFSEFVWYYEAQKAQSCPSWHLEMHFGLKRKLGTQTLLHSTYLTIWPLRGQRTPVSWDVPVAVLYGNDVQVPIPNINARRLGMVRNMLEIWWTISNIQHLSLGWAVYKSKRIPTYPESLPPLIPKPFTERSSFIKRWLSVWGMFQGYVWNFLELNHHKSTIGNEFSTDLNGLNPPFEAWLNHAVRLLLNIAKNTLFF